MSQIISLSTGGATTPTTYVTDAGSATPALDILNIVGGVNASTSAAGNTITIDAVAGGSLTFASDAGNASPAAGTITLAGAGATTTSAAGSTVTFTTTIPTLTFAGDSGTATPAANTITDAGGNGITTSAAGSTVTTRWSGATAFGVHNWILPAAGNDTYTASATDTMIVIDGTDYVEIGATFSF